MSISKDLISKNLNYDLDIYVYDSVTSTNSLLKELANDGAKQGTVIVASHQTLGRGRMGKSFYSPADNGIYLSVLLRPNMLACDALSLTTMSAVAVANAIDEHSNYSALIKWVNDIYINNKKVCGILAESSFNADGKTLDYIVLGIGINLTEPANGYPDDIKDIATSIYEKNDNKKTELIISSVLNNLFDLYFNETNDYIDEYINKSLVIGREISVITNNTSKPAKALEIDKDCRLKVQYLDGTTDWLSFGEISLKIV